MDKMDLKQRLNIPDGAKRALIHTKLNGETLSRETRGKVVGRGYYNLGHDFVDKDDVYVLHSWTVEDATHVLNSTFILDKTGKLIEGKVNCFALGFMNAEQSYVDQMIKEIENTKPEWEIVD